MDECYCHAYPDFDPSIVSETPSCPNDQFFNVNFEIVDEYLVSARKFQFNSETTIHSFSNVSKDKMMQESTILSWISEMGVPQESYEYVVTNILECARGMANGSHTKILSMRVVVVITRVGEDYESSEESESDEEDDNDNDDEDDDSGFVEEEFEEYLEEYNDDGLVPTSKCSIEELEKVGDEREGDVKGSCAICFEDLVVGVRMPCFHMFHTNCIMGWLHKANSCPLCRFQMPTK